MKNKKLTALSLFSGAGGMDVGFSNAGFEIVWANDIDRDACKTYELNHGSHIHCGDLREHMDSLNSFKGVDLVIGGPPCQGFSVAGKMDPNDERSRLIWAFLDVVEKISPLAFVMENVKALGALDKWSDVRKTFLDRAFEMGYETAYIILNSSDFGVPQNRERVFFVGFKNPDFDLKSELGSVKNYATRAQTVKETLLKLDRAGKGNNIQLCKAKITLAKNPVLRKSPYAGMLFNGAGRPLKLDGFSATLPASMGGNKTPIVDELELYEDKESWVENYHKKMLNGNNPPEDRNAPKRLRRITVTEAQLIQTFPLNYEWAGSQSSIYKQIGNAVPCKLAESMGKLMADLLLDSKTVTTDKKLPDVLVNEREIHSQQVLF